MTAVEAQKAASGTTFTASAGTPAPKKDAAAPVMLGVGVKAEEIVRHQ